MPSKDEICSNLPDKDVHKKKIRVFIITTKRMMANYVFYSRKNGYNTVSEALRTGIRDWIEGTLKLKSRINEDILLNVTDIEKIYGNKIIEWKFDTNDFEIHLEENLLLKFDKHRLQMGFKSRTKAVCAIMFHQILEWKEKYDSTQKKKEVAKNPYVIEGEKRLKQELEGLKQKYGFGHELSANWLPDAKNQKEAEVIGTTIYIYSLTFKEALKWLKHEYREYVLKTYFSKPYIDALNAALVALSIFVKKTKDYLDGDVYKDQEKIIDSFFEN